MSLATQEDVDKVAERVRSSATLDVDTAWRTLLHRQDDAEWLLAELERSRERLAELGEIAREAS